VGECLRVLYERRRTVDAPLGGARRHERRDRRAAAEVADQRGFLPREEPRRRGGEAYGDPVLASVSQRPLQSAAQIIGAVRVDVKDGTVGPGGFGG
jgi:hypothetical protein